MGKCSKCGKRIEYNRYVMFEGRVLCSACNIKRLLKLEAAIEKRRSERAMKKLLKPSKKAKRAGKKLGIALSPDVGEIVGNDDKDDGEENAESAD